MSIIQQARELLDAMYVNNEFSTVMEITKSDDELQVVWGWASIIEKDGKPIVDGQGDLIYEPELVKAAHDFVRDSRIGGLMHARGAEGQVIEVGRVVESMVLTKSLKAAAGIATDVVGWLIGVHVPDPDVWTLVKRGLLPAFSIGGTGVRVPVEIEA